MNDPIVIIGSGLAGYTLAKEIRALDKERSVIIVTADDGAVYSKPMLSTALACNQSAADLATMNAVAMADKLAVEIRTLTRVERIDTANNRLITDQGDLKYANLVLTLGAAPIRPPMAGNAAEQVLSINSLGDYAVFREKLNDKIKRIAIIGPGLIGCEFANDLLSSGREPLLIGPDPHPISTLLPPLAGKQLQATLGKAGAQWRLGTTVASVDARGDGFHLKLADATEEHADLAITAIGLRPETRLAQAAGLETNRGIVTDRQLKTSDSAVYALGDCAEVAGLNLPFVMPIMHGARALARTLVDAPTQVVYPAMPVAIKTSRHPVVAAPPARDSEGSWQETTTENGSRSLFRSADGDLLGFALTGDAVAEKQSLSKELPAVLA